MTRSERKAKEGLEFFENWYDSLKYVPANKGPARGTIAATLVILERLQDDFNLDLGAHTAVGGVQIKGASGAAVKRVLKRFGEERIYIREGGRTNRGARKSIGDLLEGLRALSLDQEPEEVRQEILETFQQRLVDKIQESFSREKIRFLYTTTRTARSIVKSILNTAKEDGKHGPVAEYLVGAKLAVRFDGEIVRNTSYSASDAQTDEPGDFCVGNTAFHVTVAPNVGHHDRCKINVEDGFRAYLLVPDEQLESQRRMAEGTLPDSISVESIESFVAENLDEMAGFDGVRLKSRLRTFFEVYNMRVDAVETDKSLLIEIPKNLV